MSCLTLHVQDYAGWIPEFLRLSGAPYIKCLDPPEQNPYPGTRIIGRRFIPDEETNAMVWQGEQGAAAFWNRNEEFFKSRDYVFAWESANEPHPMRNPAFRRSLDEFTSALTAIFARERLMLVAHCWSVGWSDIGDAPDFAESITALHNHGFYLGLHEYGCPEVLSGDGWWTLRYRRTVAELQQANIPIPRIILSEIGIDGGLIGRPKTGWRDYASEAQYLSQLAAYDAELMKDDYVVAATIFTTVAPGWGWDSFHVDESLAMKLAVYIALHPTPPIPPPTPPEPPVPPPDPPEPPEPPEPPPDPDAARWAKLFRQLDHIIALLRGRV